MPPNQKGGKGYKKGKHSKEDDKCPEWNEKEGQMLGRVLKKLGDRRFRVYCNDYVQRICRLAGSMRKSDWVNEGSVIIISKRDITTVMSHNSESNQEDLGDICGIVDKGWYGKLKKQPGVCPLLFTALEQQDAKEIAFKAAALKRGETIEDDVFAYDSQDESEDDEDNESGEDMNDEEKAKAKQRSREERAKKRDAKIADERNKKQNQGKETDDVDIDAI